MDLKHNMSPTDRPSGLLMGFIIWAQKDRAVKLFVRPYTGIIKPHHEMIQANE